MSRADSLSRFLPPTLFLRYQLLVHLPFSVHDPRAVIIDSAVNRVHGGFFFFFRSLVPG